MLKRNSTFEKAYKIKGIALKNLNKEKANAEKAIGNKYFREKKFKLAIEKYEDIIEKYGSDITLFNNIATCYFKLGQEDSHNFVISREMSVNVNSFWIWFFFANLGSRGGSSSQELRLENCQQATQDYK